MTMSSDVSLLVVGGGPAGVTAALQACDSEIAALRREGLTRPLSTAEVERLFALGFGLDQLFQNAGDLARRIEEYSTGRAA